MRTCTRWACLAAAVALFAPALASAGEYRGEKTVPLSKDGIVALDLEVGPVLVNELVLRGVPDAEELASMPGEKTIEPRPVSVTTNRGGEEVEMRLDATFFDDQGAIVYACGNGNLEQDEETFNEVRRVCSVASGGSVTAAKWSKVTSVKLQVSLHETD
ncbi:MAG TPA: hypothetical protein VEB43_03195 [Anaeromyxobacter sp.]|nr:hypothetical protein [Anaeromyxobacter sp.]